MKMTKYIDTIDRVMKQLEQRREDTIEELDEKIKDLEKDIGVEKTMEALKKNGVIKEMDIYLTKKEKNKILKGLEVEEVEEVEEVANWKEIEELEERMDNAYKKIESTEDELKETEIITIEIEKEFVINTGNYSSIKQKYGIKREGRTKNITNFLQQTDDIISKKVNEQFNKIKASL